MTIPMRTSLRGGAVLLLAATLAAQKMPLPDGPGRQLQLFDLTVLRPKEAPAFAAPQLLAGKRREPSEPTDFETIARMLEHFVDPPLGPGDACQLLGDRWLAVIGSPAQVASIERLFHLAVRHREHPIEVTVQLLLVDDTKFTGNVKQHLVEVVRDEQVSFEVVLDEKQAKELTTRLDLLAPQRIDAPTLSVLPLQRGHLSVIDQTAYVRDFNLTRKGDALIADPIVDVVWDGNITDVCATLLPDGMIGVTCDVAFQEVQKPIRTFETTIGKDLPVTLQLPRVTGTRLRQTAVLGEGSLVVLATQKASGDWIVALVRAKTAPR